MQSREEMISSILAFGIKMRYILAEANIKQNYLEIPEKKEVIPTLYLEEGLTWIQKVHDIEFAACLATKDLVPESQWLQYRFLDMEGAAEVIQLKQNFRALRKKIINKNRPAVFRRKVFHGSKRTTRAGKKAEAGTSKTETPSPKT